MPYFKIFRFRSIRETGNEMYDPVLDMLRIFPAAIGNTLTTLEAMWEDTDVYPDACDMAHKIHNLIEAVLPEDTNDIDRTLNEFVSIWRETPEALRNSFLEVLFMNLVTFFGVAVRRAEGGKKPVIQKPEELMEFSLLTYLQDSTAASVKKELRGAFQSSVAQLRPNSDQGKVTLECDGKVIEDAKKWVASLVPVANGQQSWETISSIIRRQVDASTREGQMAKQVYPSYRGDTEDAR